MSLSIYHNIDTLHQDVDILKNKMAHLKDTSVTKENVQQIIKDTLEATKSCNMPQEKNAIGNVLNGETMDTRDGHDLEEASMDSNMPHKYNSVQNAIIGVSMDTLNDDELQRDVFSMMMLSKEPKTWFIGLISFGIQMTLGVLVIEEQVDTTSFGTFLSIPF